MIEGNDQSLEYIGYQVPRTDMEGGGNLDDPDNKAQTQGIMFDDSKFSINNPNYLNIN